MEEENIQIKVFKDILIRQKPELEEKMSEIIATTKTEYKRKYGQKIDTEYALVVIAEQFGINLLVNPELQSKIQRTDLEKYLDARDQIKDFYQYEVWKKLESIIDNLCIEINCFDSSVYDQLQSQYCIRYLKEQVMPTLFNFDKIYPDPPKNLEGLIKQEISVLTAIPEEFKKVFKQMYAAFIPSAQIDPKQIDSEGFHKIHQAFQKINIKIRYPSNGHVENPYTSANKNLYKSSYELLEYHRGILESVKSQRDFQTHVTDLVAPAQFKKAERTVADPLTKITLPTNYIMLSNFSISCVYEIIELMQIWVDSNKIGKENSS